METLLGYKVEEREIVHLSFNHRNKQKLKTAIWFCVKYMFLMFSNRDEGLAQSLAKIGREVRWMIRIGKWVGERESFEELNEMIDETRIWSEAN